MTAPTPAVLTAEEIEGLRTLEEEASPSPWRYGDESEATFSEGSSTIFVPAPDGATLQKLRVLARLNPNFRPWRDSALIVAVRNALPRLLDTIDAQAAEIERLTAIVDLVSARGSHVHPSEINRGYVVVVDGRTDEDACERTAAECFDYLLAAHRGRSAAPTDPAGTTP